MLEESGPGQARGRAETVSWQSAHCSGPFTALPREVGRLRQAGHLPEVHGRRKWDRRLSPWLVFESSSPLALPWGRLPPRQKTTREQGLSP